MMQASEYQQESRRTECDQAAALARIANLGYHDGDLIAPAPAGQNATRLVIEPEDLVHVRLLHSAMGMTNELGEITSTLQKVLWYGQRLGNEEFSHHEVLRQKLADEYGDLMWHLVQGLNAVGLRLEDVLAGNIKKLRQRYPGRWDPERAEDAGRDRAAEEAAQRT